MVQFTVDCSVTNADVICCLYIVILLRKRCDVHPSNTVFLIYTGLQCQTLLHVPGEMLVQIK